MSKAWAGIAIAIVATVAAAAGLSMTTAPARAFVLEGPVVRPWTPAEDVARAARWDSNARAFAVSGERGLGGGLEYAVHDSVCANLVFLDAPAPSCDTIKDAIAEAMGRWSAGHPGLRFTDATGRIAVKMQGRSPPYIGQGAEIDFIAMGVDQFMAFSNRRIAAMTNYFYDTSRRPRLTDGSVAALSMGVLTAADVRLSTRTCYFMDMAFERIGCAHFPSLIKHEIGHVLGIEHPDQHADRNLAALSPTVANGTCADAATFTLSTTLDPHATANSILYGAAIWRQGLTADDLAARDAMYPPCAPQTTPTFASAASDGQPAEPAQIESAGQLPEDVTAPKP